MADQPKVIYNRKVLVTVLVYHHWTTNTKPCSCGWRELGRSYPEHIADVYEESIIAKL